MSDGRLPSGSHAHSGGVEPVGALITDLDDLRSFLRGRLCTAGLLAAALAAAAARVVSSPGHLDGEADARMPSPAAREASRKQGRQLLRTVRSVWPSAAYGDLPPRPHHPVVLGVAARVAGLVPGDAALAAAHGSVTGAASAAVRLLSLDPIAVHRLLAELGADVDAVAVAATVAAERGEIPAPAAPLVEIAAEDHATWEVRLFAS
jgi:urease accessory protein